MLSAADTEKVATIIGDATWTDLIIAASALFLLTVFAKGLTLYLRRVLKDRMEETQIKIFTKALYYGIVLVSAFIIFSTLGVNLSSLLVAGGVMGVIIGFASQRIIGNLISGIFLFIERPMKISDTVKIGDKTGIVEDIRIFSTLVRSFDGLCVRIPNEKVFTTQITNYVTHAARRFDFSFSIRYEDDAAKAMELVTGLITDHPFTLHSPGPVVYVNEYGDNGVEISVLAWGPVAGWWGAKTDIMKALLDALKAEGIEMPFPQRVVHTA